MLISVLLSCTKPFEAEDFQFEKIVVVDGTITDELKAHEVSLSYTYPIGSTEDAKLSGAKVWVQDDQNVIYNYSESTPGIYISDEPFAATLNRSYELMVTTPDGKNYKSTQTEFIPAPAIDSIYNKYVTIALEDATENESGLHFFIDTHDENNAAKYFRYEWNEAYKIITPYTSFFIINDSSREIEVREELLNICYIENASIKLLIANSVGSADNRVAEFPIRFISQNTDALRYRYSLEVKQYSISEGAYSYYRKLKESNESGGSLFDKQQGTIIGNIESVDDPNETVIGYFETSGVATLRSYFNPSDLDPNFPTTQYRYFCDPIIYTTFDSIEYYSNRNPALEIVNIDTFNIPETTLVTNVCTNCSLFADLEKPAYWID